MTEVIPSASNMLSVLKLFIIPVGGGIPGGVMLAQANGLAVIAISTLRLNKYIKDPNITMLIILVAMFSVPALVRFIRSRRLLPFQGT